MTQLIDPDRALEFLDFVAARHQVWEARQAGLPEPWTTDPIVATRKFTNVFRILDPGTQFIMTDLIRDNLSYREMLYSLFLYRHTGRVEAWRHLYLELGRYPDPEDSDDIIEIWKEYRGGFKEITGGSTTPGGPLRRSKLFERPVFTGAYLVFPQSQEPGTDKLESIVRLAERLFDSDDVVSPFLTQEDPRDQFQALRKNKGVADFMSMQILTDWGYTPHCGTDREDDYVVLGPGARKGAMALLNGRTGSLDDVHRWATESICDLDIFLPLDSYGENLRQPSYMDVQNTLCEFSKYVRYAEKPVPAKLYQPAHPGPQPSPVLPKHW